MLITSGINLLGSAISFQLKNKHLSTYGQLKKKKKKTVNKLKCTNTYMPKILVLQPRNPEEGHVWMPVLLQES